MRLNTTTSLITILLLISIPLTSFAQNVGIGTTDPDARLHVAGAIQTDSALIVKPYTTTAADTISIASNVGLLIIHIDSASQTNYISLTGTAKTGQMLQIINLDNESAVFGGFTIQDNSSAGFIYSGTSWISSQDKRVLSDLDGDTRIEVESNSDEDLINLIVPDGIYSETWTFSSTNIIPPNAERISIGNEAGYNLTGDEMNTITIGNSAGYNLTDETVSVIAIGSSALSIAGEIEHTVAVGTDALDVSTGNYNTAVGSSAGRGTSGFSGGLNCFFGASSGYSALGSSNVMVGSYAGFNATGSNNLILGNRAGFNATGSNNILLGYHAGYNETGSNKLYIANSDTSNPLIYGAFDSSLLRVNGTLDINNAYQFPTVDGDSGQVLITDGSGVVTWVDKSNGAIDSLSDADGDTRIEVESNPDEDLINLIIPYGSNPQTWTFSSTNLITPLRHRISIGHDAGYSLTGDESNTITIGNSAGYNLTDETSSVIAIGSSALATGGEIVHSVAVGSSALGQSTGNENTAVGSQAGRGGSGFSGAFNCFFGTSSGRNALGSGNVMVGSSSGYNASGSNCVILGSRAGFNATGSNNIFIGYRAGYDETGSNKLYIANSDTSNPLIYGAFDSSLLRVNGTLDINNAYQLPTVDGDSGQVLITDGSGVVTWVDNDNSYGAIDSLSDEDGDTKIQVEANTDEDKIRFVLGGTERWHMAEGRLVPNSSNIMIGLDAGESVTSGTNNTILGYYSGNSLTTGSNNIFLGNRAGFYETGSNKLYVSISDTANPLIYGEFDNNLLRINGALDINNAYQLPTVDGDSGQVLITDGSGVVTWVDNDKSNGAIDSLSDEDGDTKIKVEATTDEDKIRFSFPVHGDWVMHPIRIETPLSMVIFGRNAGGNLDSDAVNTVVIGSNAAFNSSGEATNNVVVGSSALYEAGETEHNTAIGASSLYKATGTYNTALGSNAGNGDSIYNGAGNVFIGASSGFKARGSYNVLVGQNAGYNNKGSSNVFIGRNAGYNASGSDKLYIENSNSSSPLIYGEFDNDLLRINGTLDINNAYQLPTVDGDSGQVLYTDGTGTIGWTTPFVGFLDSITDADGDTKILLEKNADEDKIRFNIAGSEKWIMVGSRIEPSSDNTVIGQNAGDSITSGQGLTAFGANALKSNTTASNNTAFGLNALQAATTGQFNGAYGAYAGYSLQSGSHNVFVGNSAGYSNVNGSQNTFIGQYAGYGNLGSGNVFIGRYAGGNETSSNKLYIANTNTSSPLIYGEFDNAELQFNGDVLPGATATYTLGSSTNRWKVIYANNGTIQTSDRRYKTNINTMAYGLGEVMKLRSVSYNWKQDSLGKTKLGFIAQELEEVIPEVVFVAEDSMQTRGVNYAELVPVLVRAIQEQQQIIEAQQTMINNQQTSETSQNEQLKRLEARLIYLEKQASSK